MSVWRVSATKTNTVVRRLTVTTIAVLLTNISGPIFEFKPTLVVSQVVACVVIHMPK